MTSIPLLCNICPKQPDFSDISHLLTHVASKGHLAQELKAKVRARQDGTIREKLDAYDRWYEKHQIEKLLSQRLILKESKEAATTRRVRQSCKSNSAGSAKNVKPRKRRAKAPDKAEEASPLKSEEPLIDPQLSWLPPSSPSPFGSLSGHGGSQQHDKAFNPRYHIPRMCEQQDTSASRRAAQTITPSRNPSALKALHDPGPDTDSETDYFNTFIRSPTMPAYPDPSEMLGLPFSFSPPRAIEQAGERVNLTPDFVHQSIEKEEPIQPPVLKGVKWPGMSIFDSASLEAQRLRNQKKDGSILEQMEHNSIVVEQMERIYWPDGSLKQKRLITGNVESSPPRELTPPPKRQRTKAKKNVLTDISTNAPRPTRRGYKASGNTQASDLRNISKKALATLDAPPPQSIYPRSAHMGYDAANDQDLERRLTGVNASRGRQRAFDIFNESVAIGAPENAILEQRLAKASARTEDGHFIHDTHCHQGSSKSQRASTPARRAQFAPFRPSAGYQTRAPSDGLPREAQLRTSRNDPEPPSIEEDSENIEPIIDGDGRIDDQVPQAHRQRVTQRYFSVTGNQPPQFFNSLPPHMDFGGLAEAQHPGSTLNLLNPYLRQHQFPAQYAPMLFRHPTPQFWASHQDDIGKSGRLAVAKQENSNETQGF